MKTIIAGSRSISDPTLLDDVLGHIEWGITEVFCGGARGVDTLGEEWAKAHRIPIKYFIPNWDGHGKAAGHIRNAKMADTAEACVVVWDGKSRGSKGMIQEAINKKLPLLVYNSSDNSYMWVDHAVES